MGGATEAGEAMGTAGEYIKSVWLPAHTNDVEWYNVEQGWYKLNIDNIDYGCFIEVYKISDMVKEPEMCYYIPLKDKQVAGRKVEK